MLGLLLLVREKEKRTKRGEITKERERKKETKASSPIENPAVERANASWTEMSGRTEGKRVTFRANTPLPPEHCLIARCAGLLAAFGKKERKKGKKGMVRKVGRSGVNIVRNSEKRKRDVERTRERMGKESA